MLDIFKQMRQEVEEYSHGDIEISEGYRFSQANLIKRISIYANGIYPDGKVDSQGDVKYWIDIIQPRIDSEVKNVDFDTRDISLYSEPKHATAISLLNIFLQQWMKNNQQAVELNEAIEQGSGWGNVVWKKLKSGYELVDLKNFYVINQQAKCLDDTPVIERHILTQRDLREKAGIWQNINEVIKECGNKSFSGTVEGVSENKETPYYEIYERNGEVSMATLLSAKGEDYTEQDEEKYVLAKIIVAGLKKAGKNNGKVLFAEEISKMPYKEYHRGRYNGRWWRLGIIEILMDIQTRANEISNQISRGLAWASKVVFRSTESIIASNILTDLNSGDIIKSTDLQQVNLRMEGLDQLIADWNRLMVQADQLCNSYEVVTGEGMPSGTPFRLGALMNQNANKLFDFIREKLALAVQEVFQDWILPEILKEVKAKTILELTGDARKIEQYYKLLVDDWYIKNLLYFAPHTPEMAELAKQEKVKELMNKPQKLAIMEKEWLDDIKPKVIVTITGENVNKAMKLENLSNFIKLEADPVRRSYLISLAMQESGINVDELPRSTPEQLNGIQPQSQTQATAQQKTPVEAK